MNKIMPFCYFENDHHKKYECSYEIKERNLEIQAEYDISNEVESVNGVKFFGSNTEYRERDILIIDYENKKNPLKVFSKFINDLIGYPSLEIKESDSEFSVNLSKVNCSKSIDINSNNVKRITVADDWSSSLNRKLHNITIDFNGYIEIELI